jgi:hypothetical protein
MNELNTSDHLALIIKVQVGRVKIEKQIRNT